MISRVNSVMDFIVERKASLTVNTTSTSIVSGYVGYITFVNSRTKKCIVMGVGATYEFLFWSLQQNINRFVEHEIRAQT